MTRPALSRLIPCALALTLSVVSAVSTIAQADEIRVGILPPEGWTRIDAKGTNLIAAWRDPQTKHLTANLTLAHDDTTEPLNGYVLTTVRALQASLPNSVPVSSKISICHGRPAYDLVDDGVYDGSKVRIEELVTDIGGKKFIGTYTRPEDGETSAIAEASLRSICPKE